MREFGFGAKRVLQPYQNPEAKDFFRAFRPSQEELDNPFLSSPYARQQDALVAQEDMVNQQLAAEQAQMMADQRKASRLEQVYEAEDLANEALASGVPPDEVIQLFPRLAQSPSFSNYMQQAREVRPAQKTLAPHFRQSLKSPTARTYFDRHFQATGDATQAYDLAQADEEQDDIRLELVKNGVPVEIAEAKVWTPLAAQAAIQQFSRKTEDDPNELAYKKTVDKYFADLANSAAMAIDGEEKSTEQIKADLDRIRSIFYPQAAPAPVSTVKPPTATKATSKVKSLAERYGILKPKQP